MSLIAVGVAAVQRVCVCASTQQPIDVVELFQQCRVSCSLAATGMSLSRCYKRKLHGSSFLARMSACRATSPFSLLYTRSPDWSAGGLLRCSAARLSVCRVVLQIPRARHARLVADILARMLYEENARVEFQLHVRRTQHVVVIVAAVRRVLLGLRSCNLHLNVPD